MEYLKNKFIDLYTLFGYSDYNKIINNLYVGNYKSCQNDIITKENFEVIINCTPNLPFHSENTHNYRLNVKDNISYNSNIIILKKSIKLLPLIHQNIHNKKILIHCRAGQQRSATLATMYLMKYHNMSAEKAKIFVREKRPNAFFIGPNFNFAIHIFENYLKSDK
tara:strand:- start:661 stop:1155 length:495 start_codon:yes stop_codon:yes gene_type:complete